MGHSGNFLTKAANNVLSILTASQREQLVTLAANKWTRSTSMRMTALNSWTPSALAGATSRPGAPGWISKR